VKLCRLRNMAWFCSTPNCCFTAVFECQYCPLENAVAIYIPNWRPSSVYRLTADGGLPPNSTVGHRVFQVQKVGVVVGICRIVTIHLLCLTHAETLQ